MFDAEKLLGGLLGSGLSRHGLGSALGNLGNLGNLGGLGKLAKPGNQAVAMGLLGVAVAAFEHFTENRGPARGTPAAPGPAPAVPPQPPGVAPPAPPAAPATADARPTAPPPPPPGAVPPPPAGDPGAAAQEEALLYVRGMIASAAADGTIDDAERSKILGQLDASGLDAQEREFLLGEMERPATVEQLAAGAREPQQALRLYVCSLLAVEVDTEAEREHLRRLARALQLPPDTLDAVHARYQVSL